MTAPIMTAAINEARQRVTSNSIVVAMTPQGKPVNESVIIELSGFESLIFVAGRYEGLDERVMEAEIDIELSIGDFVVSGQKCQHFW